MSKLLMLDEDMEVLSPTRKVNPAKVALVHLKKCLKSIDGSGSSTAQAELRALLDCNLTCPTDFTVNTSCSDQPRILEAACGARGRQRCPLPVIEFLVEEMGAEINWNDVEHSDAALSVAAKADRVDVVEYLLTQGADVNFQNKEGNTALHFAASCVDGGGGSTVVCQALLDGGADVNLRNNADGLGETAADVAARGSLSVVDPTLGLANEDTSVDSPHAELVKLIAGKDGGHRDCECVVQ